MLRLPGRGAIVQVDFQRRLPFLGKIDGHWSVRLAENVQDYLSLHRFKTVVPLPKRVTKVVAEVFRHATEHPVAAMFYFCSTFGSENSTLPAG
jgi:hypothetical protein